MSLDFGPSSDEASIEDLVWIVATVSDQLESVEMKVDRILRFLE